MAETVLADTGFLFALHNRRDRHHEWATATAFERSPPWHTCEAVLSESFHLLGSHGIETVGALLERRMLRLNFDFDRERSSVLKLIRKYADVPMSIADACLVRMTEILPDPILLTTDADFRVYRRHSRQVIPCIMPN